MFFVLAHLQCRALRYVQVQGLEVCPDLEDSSNRAVTSAMQVKGDQDCCTAFFCVSD